MCLLYDGFFCRRSAEVGLFYILIKFLSLCFHQFFNVIVFVTDHFDVDTITYTIVTIGIMFGIIENVDDFSFIHPSCQRFYHKKHQRQCRHPDCHHDSLDHPIQNYHCFR